jgi:hypothetical protein
VAALRAHRREPGALALARSDAPVFGDVYGEHLHPTRLELPCRKYSAQPRRKRLISATTRSTGTRSWDRAVSLPGPLVELVQADAGTVAPAYLLTGAGLQKLP